MNKGKKLLGKVATKTLEEYAFAVDLIRVPGLRRQQEKLILSSYALSNKIRKVIGEKPKRFIRVKEGNILEVVE